MAGRPSRTLFCMQAYLLGARCFCLLLLEGLGAAARSLGTTRKALILVPFIIYAFQCVYHTTHREPIQGPDIMTFWVTVWSWLAIGFIGTFAVLYRRSREQWPYEPRIRLAEERADAQHLIGMLERITTLLENYNEHEGNEPGAHFRAIITDFNNNRAAHQNYLTTNASFVHFQSRLSESLQNLTYVRSCPEYARPDKWEWESAYQQALFDAKRLTTHLRKRLGMSINQI